jgi:tetratricopeptide (TPR) repeat protein
MSEQGPESISSRDDSMTAAQGAPSDLEAQVRALLDQAVELHRAGRLDEAEGFYRQVLELDPRDPNALTNIGTIFFQRGRIPEGVPYLEASLKAKPNQPNALSNLANGLTALGRFEEAKVACEQAVDLEPANADAWNNLGNARRELGDIDGAVEAYETAFAANPKMASALGNEATLLRAVKRLDETAAVLERALAADPLYVDAWNELGNCLQEQGKVEESLTAYDRALAIQPDHPEAISNSAVALTTLKRFDEAIALCDRALALRPAYADAWHNRGNALRGQKHYEEAAAAFERALALKPEMADAWNNLGIVRHEQGRREEALDAFDQAVTRKPEFGEAHANRANALRELGRLEEALDAYDTAMSRGASRRDATNNRGICLAEMHRFDEAIAAFEEAGRIDPDFAESPWNKSIILLMTGDEAEGWRLYEQRWKREEFKAKPNPYGKTPWLGERDIAGKVLLVTAEQGIGDTLQMLRYAPLLADRGIKVLAAVQNALVDLARQVPGMWGVLGEGQPIPHWDEFVPTMSLPLVFGATRDTIPQDVPYVFAPEAAAARWAERLGPKTAPRVGLVWSGSREHKNDRNRSIPLQTLRPLLDLGAELISLQIDYRDGDLPVLRADGRILDLKDEIKSFADTAGIMEQLDLVISVDTSVAHLAGAMGKPLWLLLPYTPDFRWRLDAADTPWYPTARLWRQGEDRRWEPVVDQLRAAAEAWLKTA